MEPLYLSDDDEARHLLAMKRLASETGHELAFVRAAYEDELARLMVGARTRGFLLVLAHRHTREFLAKARLSAQARAGA